MRKVKKGDMMKFVLWLFLLGLPFAVAYHTSDYTKNGFAVPGYVNVLIPDVQEVLTPVQGPTLVTQPKSEGRQLFVESHSGYPVAQPSFRVLGEDARSSARVLPINPLDRSCEAGFYIGDYGLSRQYIKSRK